MQEVFKVPEVHCGHCKSAIEGSLSNLDGVERAEVDLEAKSVAVSYDDAAVGRERIVEEIQEAGYAVA